MRNFEGNLMEPFESNFSTGNEIVLAGGTMPDPDPEPDPEPDPDPDPEPNDPAPVGVHDPRQSSNIACYNEEAFEEHNVFATDEDNGTLTMFNTRYEGIVSRLELESTTTVTGLNLSLIHI